MKWIHKFTAMIIFFVSLNVFAETPIFNLEIRDHLFFPPLIIIPANTKVKLVISNMDSTAEEFESYLLKREKVILGKSQAIIFIGPLPLGDYPFYGEYNPKTATGIVRVSN